MLPELAIIGISLSNCVFIFPYRDMLDGAVGLSTLLTTLIISQTSEWLRFYPIPGELIKPDLGLGRNMTKCSIMLIYVNKTWQMSTRIDFNEVRFKKQVVFGLPDFVSWMRTLEMLTHVLTRLQRMLTVGPAVGKSEF